MAVEQASLETRVERAVAAELQRHRDEISRLVELRVDAEIEHLVAEVVASELAQRTNGAAPESPSPVTTSTAPPAPDVAAAPTILCTQCGNEPALHHRTVGLSCLRARRRELDRRRRAAVSDGDEEPAPVGIAPEALARLVRRTTSLCNLPATDLTAWLVDGELARVDRGLLVPTALAVELGGQLTSSA